MKSPSGYLCISLSIPSAEILYYSVFLLPAGRSLVMVCYQLQHPEMVSGRVVQPFLSETPLPDTSAMIGEAA